MLKSTGISAQALLYAMTQHKASLQRCLRPEASQVALTFLGFQSEGPCWDPRCRLLG